MNAPNYLPPLDPELAMRVAGLNEEQQEFWSERAAIREYCGGLARDDAERAAWQDTVQQFDLAG